jgi:iron(III) transport system permease protein
MTTTTTTAPITFAARRQRPPAALLAGAALVVVPLVFPLLALLYQALAGTAWQGVLPAGRLAHLGRNTLLLAAAVVATTAAIGTTTAWLTTKTDLRLRRMWSTLVSLPLVIPSYVAGLVLLGATGNRGIISGLVATWGWGPVPIPRGFWGAWLVLSLITYPYVHLSLVAAFRGLDPALEESARGLGAGRWRRWRTVTLPQVLPALRASSLLVGLYTMADFGAVALLRYDTFTRAIFLQYAGRLDRRPATLLAAVLMLMALAVVWIERATRARQGRTAPRSVRPAPLYRLIPGGRLAAIAFLAVLVAVALVIPVAVLGGWLARGVGSGLGLAGVLPETVRSLGVSAAAAVAAVGAAIPLAVLTARYRSRFGVMLESVAWSIYALPHLTVGLAVLLVAVGYLLPLYQTLALLLFAYVAMFLPQALGPVQASLGRTPPSLEEASRSLGRGPFPTLGRITIPLISRGLLAGAGLVFLTTMKELPATLLLRPTGFETLAVRIWSTTSEGFYTQGALAAVVLLAVSAVPLHLLITRDLHE